MFRSIRARILLASVATFAIMLALLQWSAQRQLGDALGQSLALQGELAQPLLAAAVAPLMASRDYATLEDLVQRSVGPQGLAAMEVVDTHGQRVAGKDSLAEGHALTVPLVLAGQPYGEVRLRLHTALLAEARRRVFGEGLWIGLAVLAGGSLLLTLVLTVLGQGARRLLQASRSVAAGDAVPALPVTGGTEIQELSAAFNRMSASVQAQVQALRASEQHLRTVLAVLSEGLLVQDREGRVTDCNEAATRVLRRSRTELLAGEAFHPRNELRWPNGRLLSVEEQPALRTLRSGQPQRGVLLQLAVGEDWIWILVNSEPIVAAPGEPPSAVVSTITDVSSRIQAEEALRQANQSLEQRVAERTAELVAARDAAEQASRAKSEFLSRMSHELRTPLNAILGFAQLLALTNPARPAQELQQLRQIEAAGWHLLELIDEVLDLARVEAGAMTVSLEPVELGALVDHALEMAGSLARRHEVTLIAPLPARGGVWVRADRKRLLQVLNNLLSNAVKYNRAQGEVRLEVERQDGHWRLTVSDTGRGLSAAQIEQLFQPFTRFDNGAGQAPVEGTGIGLAITQRLVELMQGRLELQSTPGAGSRFTLVLPASAAGGPAAAPPPATLPLSGNGPRRRVVYVEDNPSNVRLLTEVLAQRQALSLAVAIDGEGGLALLRSQPPDLAIIDIDLPGLDGIELCRRLKADPATAGVPLLALSAQAMPRQVERMHAAGFDRVMTKPIDVPRLLALVDELLARPSPAAPGA